MASQRLVTGLLALSVVTTTTQAFRPPVPFVRSQSSAITSSPPSSSPDHPPIFQSNRQQTNIQRWSALQEPTPTTLPLPYKPELGVGRQALLTKVLELTRGNDYVRVYEDDMVLSAVRSMNEVNADCCLVFNKDNPGELAGIFTERDYVRKIVEAQRKTSETPISDVMTPADKVISATPNMRVGECMNLMVTNKIRHIPVIDSEIKRVLGVISTTDLVKTMKKDDESLAGRFPIGSLDPFMVQDYVASARETANALALKGGTQLTEQDYVRGGFVAAGSFVFALLLQGNWLHDHEVLSMVGIFIMGYVGIILENIFEFNKAAVGLLMATALWVIYAGTAGAKGIASAAALGELGEHVSEVSKHTIGRRV